MTEISDSLQALLVRQGMRGNGLPGPALHVMMWANEVLDREEGGVESLHSPAAEWDAPPMRIHGAEGAKPPAVGGRVNAQEPSPARSRPVLRLVYSSNRRRPTRYVIGPRLVLINGGKE